MLELDTWLNRFLDAGHGELTIAQQRHFIYLLQQDDMTLFAWFTGAEEAPSDLRELLDAIRKR